MPVTIKCSCGHQETVPDGRRGIEQECEACGRVWRVPATGTEVDLGNPAITQRDMATLLYLSSITPNDRQGKSGRGDRRRQRRLRLFLIGAVAGAIIAVYWYASR